MEKLTFKKYLESREQLIQAIANTPISTMEYEVRKYCILPVAEQEEKISVNLKPKTSIIVEWKYEDIDNPTPIQIKFIGIKGINETQEFSTSWTGFKLNNWLLKNTSRGINHAHKI